LLKGRKHHILEILLGTSVSAWSQALKLPDPGAIIANKIVYRKKLRAFTAVVMYGLFPHH